MTAKPWHCSSWPNTSTLVSLFLKSCSLLFLNLCHVLFRENGLSPGNLYKQAILVMNLAHGFSAISMRLARCDLGANLLGRPLLGRLWHYTWKIHTRKLPKVVFLAVTCTGDQFMKCTSVYQRFINTHPDQSCTCSKSSARREAGSVPDCHSQRRKCCVCLSCWRLSLSQQNKDSLTSDGQLTKRWTDLLLLDALTYQASVSSEEGVSHLLLFTDRLPLHLHPEVLIPAHAEGLLKQVNSSRF